MSEQQIGRADIGQIDGRADAKADEYKPRNRDGYTVTEQRGRGEGGQITYAVTRDSDGVGLGAYATQAEVDDIIDEDRSFLASREQAATIDSGERPAEAPPAARAEARPAPPQ